MPGTPSFRICGGEAAEDLARLWVRASAHDRCDEIPAAPEAERVEALATRVSRAGAAAVIAVEDETSVGCCFFEPLEGDDGETVIGAAHLSGLAVEPKRWGEGLATALLHFAEAAARDRGYRCFRLHVLEQNTRARTLYERLGWRLVSTGHPHRAGPQAVYDKTLAE